MRNYLRLSVRPETKARFLECKKVFLEHHPELKGLKITENHLLMVISDYYIES